MHFLRAAPKNKLRGVALLRLDFNTEDEWRMEAGLPSIRFLLNASEKVVIVSHRGRPSFVPHSGTTAGKPQGLDKKLSLRRDAENLAALLKHEVIFLPTLKFGEIEKAVRAAPKKSVILLENLRFWKGEEKNDKNFAKQLARLGNFYVNDAFAVSHRANASVEAITKSLPSYAGLELEKEINSLSRVLKNPKRPLVLILGGGKAHDKLGIINFFHKKADALLMGGAAANTFLKLKGMEVKKSNIDTEKGDKKMLMKALKFDDLVLPRDYLWSGNKIFDIGPKATKEYAAIIKKAKTIVWSGPMGVIEKKRFAKASIALARAVAANKKAFSIAGGGETVMFLKKYKLDKKFSFISTGGGAMLDFLAGEKLPGIKALKEKGS